jgi:hypothetical protein
MLQIDRRGVNDDGVTDMTSRTEIAQPQRREPPDFTHLSNDGARRRVAQLIALGMTARAVADLFNWTKGDVYRALDRRA